MYAVIGDSTLDGSMYPSAASWVDHRLLPYVCLYSNGNEDVYTSHTTLLKVSTIIG